MEAEQQQNPALQVGWRFRIGVGLFVLGLVCPLLVPLVAMMDLPPR